jgi:hypothetical protein
MDNANEANSMNVVRTSRLLTLAGIVTLLAFAGDIVADSIADLRGDHCISERSPSDSHHEKTPCSHCSCAVHNGTVIASTATVDISDALGVFAFFAATEQSPPSGVSVAIDHPPKLA